MRLDLARRLVAEAVGTMLLIIAVVGTVSGAHFNPIVTLVDRLLGTLSTSFAHPAVTVARPLSDTFAGIEPSSVPMFVLMQIVGAVLAFGLIRFIHPYNASITSGRG